MNTEPMTELKSIDREINRLYKVINVHAACGNAEDVNRIRDEIGKLQRQKQAQKEGSHGTGN